jgi:FixJ family two-component response regulator
MRLPSEFAVWSIDDDAFSHKIIHEALDGQSTPLVSFRSAHDVEQRLDSDVPACIVAAATGEVSGLAMVRRIHDASWPAPAILACRGVRPMEVVQALRAGVMSVVEKPLDLVAVRGELLDAIDRARTLADHLRRRHAAQQSLASLPDRYQSTLDELIQCTPQKLIAGRLNIALRTVKKRKQEIFEQLGVETYAELLSLVHLAHEGCRGWHVGLTAKPEQQRHAAVTEAW